MLTPLENKNSKNLLTMNKAPVRKLLEKGIRKADHYGQAVSNMCFARGTLLLPGCKSFLRANLQKEFL